jgi:CubicO group peptidase (beta-lactamase class C family)
MSQHPFKLRSRLLVAVASFAVLVSGGGVGPAVAAPAAASKPSDNAAWPVKAVADPTKLGFTTDGLRALNARMKEAIDKGELAGIEYSVVKDGKVAALSAIGHQTLGGPPMDQNTLIRIRSITKTITGVAMMQLWEQGKWKPEDPITKFLPEMANLKVATSDDNLDHLVPASHTPTMGELMTHTAGLGYGLNLRNAVERKFRGDDVLHAKDMNALVKEVAAIPLLAQPGDRWSYSISLDLQGAILERITGKTFGDYLKDNIFKPLAMNHTGFWLTEADRPHLATVYTIITKTNSLEPLKDADNMVSDDPFKKGSEFESGGGGSSGLISTLHDYTRFAEMLADGGQLAGHRILKPETVKFMMQNHIGALRGVVGGNEYGYAYDATVVVDEPTENLPKPKGTFGHYSIDGSWFWVDPTNKIAFVALIQRRGPSGPGGVAMGADGDATRLLYKALAK